jgi:4-hydroxy-tetrahydrodipicolinate synthase
MFEGSMTALITPFLEDGSLDVAGLEKLVDFQVKNGTDAIIACGTTGESATLSHEEHLKVLEIVKKKTKGTKVKVIFGASSNDTRKAVEATKEAKEHGADGVLSLSPYYNKPTQEGIFRHYQEIAKVGIPIVVYNVPGRTGSNIEAATTLRLAKVPNIVAVKEASGDITQIANIIKGAPPGFKVLSGDDGLTYNMMTMGAHGLISVASNIAPKEMAEMVHALQKKDYDTALKIHFRFLPLFKNLFIETKPQPVKEAAKMMGLPSGTFRLPLIEMKPENRDKLRATLVEVGLLK